MNMRQHAIVDSIFHNSSASNRTHHCYIISSSGADGIDKATIATKIATYCILGGGENSIHWQSTYSRIERKIHPDCLWIVTDEKNIKIEEVRNLAEKLSYAPMEGKKRIVIIPDAEKMKGATANAILKILEEPPNYVVFLLLTRDHRLLLPTILSRGIKINLPPYSEEELRKELLNLYPDVEEKKITWASRWGAGSLEKAQLLIGNEEYRQQVEAAGNVLLDVWEASPAIPRESFLLLDTLSDHASCILILTVWQSLIRDLALFLISPDSNFFWEQHKDRFHRVAGKFKNHSNLIFTLTEKINHIDSAFANQEFNRNMKLLLLNVCASMQITDNRSDVRKRQ